MFKPQLHPLWKPCSALCILLLIDLALLPGFFQIEIKDGHLYGSLIDILNRAAPLTLTALGMTLVIATRGIDISVGAVAAIAGTVAALLIEQHGAGVVPAVLGALGCAALCGLWNGALVVRLGLQPIITTMILMVAGRGLAQLLTDGQIETVRYAPFFVLGSGYLWGLPVSLYIVAAVLVLISLLVHQTAFGLFIEAVGINPVATRLVGIKAGALTVCVYVLCSVCAGLAGIMICSNVKSADANNIGLLLELDAILAVTLGGTSLAGGKFSLTGTLVGAMIIQTLTYTIYSLGVAPELNMIIKALVVLAVCISQSTEFKKLGLSLRARSVRSAA